ncbi:sensor domain-containing diguanylate cyclase [Novosphingobium mangrovi (ex Huang et al. 2023)]|uniref:Sensor domain-containing diguanylate cyclase n=1 Tax=Novosphingobium mangrovi (ex Huang et al. 2023) TaxID=2976432 RepID=A0ABT2I298_9SPHN|nr:sensor domain-containing diguanylate cyclase [Novosphingobium mangrovi (ex Huang et al. 2023)]MCT2398930.1 sensor domain-containing diguanylate cyclase [Novosphingobium mangrovi (ex Huang et al. 2023)]
MNLTVQESSALYGLLAESTSDIILKSDLEGNVVHASPALEKLGFRTPDVLARTHLLDYVAPEGREAVQRAYRDALAGAGPRRWVEFPAVTTDNRRRWFEIQTQALKDESGKTYGGLSIMRSIDERRELEQQLFAATYTDPLTKLTNRAAFISMLEHMIEKEMDGCLALFSIDFFRTINMQYGQHRGDEVLIVFADLLREMLRSEDIISRIGSERFAVLLPRTTSAEAEAICSRVITTLAELRQKVGESRFAITASASVASIGVSLDSTIERAEMALFVAKAKGRNRLEMEKAGRPVRH